MGGQTRPRIRRVPSGVQPLTAPSLPRIEHPRTVRAPHRSPAWAPGAVSRQSSHICPRAEEILARCGHVVNQPVCVGSTTYVPSGRVPTIISRAPHLGLGRLLTLPCLLPVANTPRLGSHQTDKGTRLDGKETQEAPSPAKIRPLIAAVGTPVLPTSARRSLHPPPRRCCPPPSARRRSCARACHEPARRPSGNKLPPRPIAAPPGRRRLPSHGGSGAGLRGRAVEEPALLRGAAVGAAPLQPARAVARPLGDHRRAAARGGPGGRLLRRRRPRQVRPAHGLHRHHARLGRHRVRGRHRRRRGVAPRARGHQVGHRLLRQGAHRALRILGRGGGRRHGPLLLAAAGGHDDVAAGVPRRQGQPRIRPRRRDRRRARRRLHRLPRLQPALLAPPPPPRAAAVRVRRRIQGQLRRERQGGAELLHVGERVRGRAAVGGLLAAPGHGGGRLPPLRRPQRRPLRRRRVGHDRVRVGQQVRRPPGPRRQATAGRRSAGRAAPAGAGAVQGQGGALSVCVPGPEQRQQREPEPRRHALRPPVEQPAVRLQRRLPPHRLLPPPRRRRRRRAPPLPRRPGGAAVRAARPGAVAGRLHPRPQPAAAELHGGLRRPLPGARAPPQRLHRLAQGGQPLHRVHAGVRRLVRPEPA